MYSKSNIKTSWSSSVPHHIILISLHQLYNYNIFIFQSCRSVKNYCHSGPTLVLQGSSSTVAFYHLGSYPFHIIPFTIRNLGLGITVPHQCVPLFLDPEFIFQHTNSCRKSVLEFIEPVFAKTSSRRSFLVIDNERFGLVFAKTGSINSGTVFSWKSDRLKQYSAKRKPIVRAMYLTCHSYIYYTFFLSQ